MSSVSRTISGVVIGALGAFIIYRTIIDTSDVWSLVWGVASGTFLCGIAVYLFLNTKEDTIDKIKRKEK